MTRKSSKGVLVHEGLIKKGKPYGTWKFYDSSTGELLHTIDMSKATTVGNPKKNVRHISNKVLGPGRLSRDYYSAKGVLYATIEFKNGKLHGKATYYDTNTVYIIGKGEHFEGKRKGEWRFYAHQTGKLHAVENYLDGKMQGAATYYDTVNKYSRGKDVKATDGQYDKNLRIGVWTFYTPSGFIEATETYKDSLMDGRAKYYDEKSGNLVLEGDFKKGIEHGIAIGYDSTTGNKLYESMFNDGKEVGPIKYYFDDDRGTIRQIETILGQDDYTRTDYYDSVTLQFEYTVYHKGDLAVCIVSRTPSGRITDSTVFSASSKVKTHISFDTTTGFISSIIDHHSSNKYTFTSFYNCNNCIESIYEYVDKVRDGKYMLYDSATHNVIAKGKYRNGKMVDEWEYFDAHSGKTLMSDTYKNGVLSGKRVKYDSSGKVIHWVTYENDKRNGIATMFYAGTQKERVVHYHKNDSLHGSLTTYYLSGKVKREEKYKNGRLLSSKCYSESGEEVEYVPLITRASFKGDVMTYIGNNLEYPDEAKKNKIEGKVIVKFMVNEVGAISNVEVVKGIGYGCDKEAVRLVKEMPSWQPYVLDGIPTKDIKKLPIVFWLQD